VWIAVSVIAACGGKPADDRSRAVTGQGAQGSQGSASGSAAAPPRRAVLTAARLSPVLIHEVASDGAVPTQIVVELAAPIVDRSAVGSPSPASNFKISPEIAGTWTHSGISALSFAPPRPFEFDRTYQVELLGVDTTDGAVAAGPSEHWTYSFRTPAFTLLGWTPSEIDIAHHRIAMDLAFSGAVLPNAALAAMTVAIDGRKPAGIAIAPSGAAGHVSVVVSDPRLALGSVLTLAIKDSLRALTGARLNTAAAGVAATAEYVVSADRVVVIKTAVITEGANGFYLEVVCDDNAAPRGQRAFYDHQGYYNLSQRCQLGDEALKHIQFDPPVARSYITSGRAGFRVFGEFKRGIYALRIDKGATSIDGGTVLSTFRSSLVVPARKPQLSFASSGRYLPRSAWTNLGIKHTNLDSAHLTVRHVPAENLVFWLGEASDAATERTSDVILDKQIPLRGAPDAAATTWLDVAELLPATTKGVLELKLAGIDSEATARLLLTNLSLVAKRTTAPGKPAEQTVQVWALDIDSAALVSDVEVSLVRKSGKAVARCTTRAGDGCTLIAKPDGDPDGGAAFALIARKGDDLSYLRYQDLRAEVAESSISGAPYASDAPYRATVFSDRGVYRPGDTAHVVAIVHDARERAPDQPLPVDVRVLDPRAKVVRKLALRTNPAGVIALDQALPVFADTGHWRVAISVADKPLASYDLRVEEFVPERMQVTATAKRADQEAGQPVAFAVAARYLFGGSAVDSGVELTCQVAPEPFAPAHNADLSYGVPPRGKPVVLGESRGQLDPDGRLDIACPDPATGTPFVGTARITATAAVLEAGSGRATVATGSAMLHPEKFYLGLRTKTARAATGQPIAIEGMVVDWTGSPVPQAVSQIHVELAHLEADYGYSTDEGSNDARYDRWLRHVPEGKLEVKVTGGKFAFDVTPGDASAGYLIRVTAGKARTELVIEGEYPTEYYGYGDDGHVDQTPRPARPTQLALALPKLVTVGEPATVSIRSPYRGKVLWTVETDRVIASEWKDIAAGEASWRFTLPAFAPNVYVTAFVVKDPHLESKDAFLPDRAYGVGSVRVAASELTQRVQLDAPKQIRSSSPLAISLSLGKVDGPAFATVAVVDEGILSLTRFASPDPLAELLGKRALGVETYETIGWTMLHQPAGASSKTGGGDGDGVPDAEDTGALGQSRVQPVKPVALFSGVLPVGPDGTLTIPFQIPSYRGQLRVMAVVATPTRIGHAEARVTVADPLVAQVTFPRFVTQNDALEIPVFLTNLSGGALEVTVALTSEDLGLPGLARPRSTTPPLGFTGKTTGTVKLAAGFSDTLVFQARALLAVGGARLRVVAKARGGAGPIEAKDEVEVPFLPAGPRERVIEKLRVEAGTLDLAARSTALKNWVPTSESTTFWMTNNPFPESFEHLGYLVHYPYGCIEQTTSSTRPLLYIANLVEQVDPQLAEARIEDLVIAGINRVFTMQTPSGGFGYWPGATEPLDWATAYATDMLLDAQQRGYAVPDDRLKEVLRWIEERVARYERGDRVGHPPWNHYDEQSEAYLHYVLARTGKAKKARIAHLIAAAPATAKGEQQEDLYLLKAALHLGGDRRYDNDLRAVDSSSVVDDRINSWSFYSDRRRRGLMLSAFYDLFGNDPAGELLARRVAEALAGTSSSYSTQELVWGVTGLGKWVTALTGKATPGGSLVADGQAIKPRSAAHKSSDKAWTVARASEYKQLTLDVPAQAAGAWLVIRSEGVRANASYKVGGNGLALTRSYRDLAGQVIDPASGGLKLGDLVFVELALSNTSGLDIQNIALVDRLPAGFEIENPRLGRSTRPGWIQEPEQWSTEFINLRDDHLEAFGALAPRTTRKLIYTVRVVTSGTFTIPPADAEAMYDPSLWARNKPGTAVVSGPWTGKLL
jgi:hypothetical protein